MFPIDYLKASLNNLVQVGTKNGDLYTGVLINCDNHMNLYLSSVSKLQIIDQKEITLSKAMIKGQNVKYLLMPNDVTQYVKERRRTPKPDKERSSDYGHRGRGGGYQARGGGHQMRGRGGYNEQRRGRGGYNKNGNHYQNRSNQDN